MIVRSQQDQPRQDINWIGVVVDDAPTAFSLYQAVREALPSAFGPVAQTSGRANDNVKGDDSTEGSSPSTLSHGCRDDRSSNRSGEDQAARGMSRVEFAACGAGRVR